MSADKISCLKCGRKIMQSISNRCMYCGEQLPEEHHLSQEEKAKLLQDKLARFKETEENADSIISGLRRDFGLPQPKKPSKQRKEDSAAAVAAAIASIQANKNGNDQGQ